MAETDRAASDSGNYRRIRHPRVAAAAGKIPLARRPGGQPVGPGCRRHRMWRNRSHRNAGGQGFCKPDDLYAPLSSGSVPAVGMVVLPCSAHTLAQIAAGLGDSLIPRAAHCQLKERRPLILCLREAPLTLIDLENARRAAAAGAVIMPMCPPFFMFAGSDPKTVSMDALLDAFVDRVLALLGRQPARTWEDIR